MVFSKEFFAMLSTLLVFSMIAPVAAGATWYVDDDGGSDYTTIQEAVNNASEYDIIIVRDGTYTENVNVNKRLTIGSENGYDSTTVTASNTNYQVFDVTADYVNISGFTVEGATGSMGVRLYSANYCNVSDIKASNNNVGIYLESSINNTLTDNTVSNNYYGIYLYISSDNNILTGNTALNNEYGIRMRFINKNNILTGNTVSNNNDYGIYLYISSNNLIYNNYFENTNNAYDDGTNTWNITKTPETNIIGGPYLGGNYWSDYAGFDTDEDGLGDTMVPYDSSGDIINGGDYHPLTEVPGTTWYVDDDGGSGFTTIQEAVDAASAGDTIIVRDGTYNENVNVNKRLTIGSENGYDSTTVTALNTNDHVFDVTADYVNISGFTVEGATGSRGVRLYSANYCNVSDINASNNNYGIYLYYSSNNNTLTGNTALNNEEGISLFESNSNILAGNTASNNGNGIQLGTSSNNTLTGNNASNNDFYGISLPYSINNTLTDNTALDNNVGIHLHHGSSYNTLTGNTVSNNDDYGIRLGYSNYNTLTGNTASSNNNVGIYLESSNYNTLTGNTASSNNNYGIYLRGSSDNTLTGNTVSNNNLFGNSLESSNNNLIYNNYFKNNPINAYDRNGANTWNITKTPETNIIGGPYLGGNYWSDYTGFDTDEDGLGDTSYSFNIGSNPDMLPLVKDFFISCDSSGDEKNMFMPGEGIYVKAEGLSPSTSYKVWIQDNPVSDGDALETSEDPSGIQEVVTSDGSGSISPTLIWDIPSDAAVTHHEYDIVLDNQSGSDVGMYNSASDRIDSTIAAGVTAPVPELTSIAMVLMGIAVILGYVRNNKEK